jgi:hypothetical protein
VCQRVGLAAGCNIVNRCVRRVGLTGGAKQLLTVARSLPPLGGTCGWFCAGTRGAWRARSGYTVCGHGDVGVYWTCSEMQNIGREGDELLSELCDSDVDLVVKPLLDIYYYHQPIDWFRWDGIHRIAYLFVILIIDACYAVVRD